MAKSPRFLEQTTTGRRYIYTDALAGRADMVEAKAVPEPDPEPVTPPEKAGPRIGRPPKPVAQPPRAPELVPPPLVATDEPS